MFLSQKPLQHESNLRPSFMSRFSSVLLPRRKPHKSKSKHKPHSDSLTRKKHNVDDSTIFTSNSTIHYNDCNQAEETGYSSIQDLDALNHEDHSTSPPPIPPKSTEDLYTKVKKKETGKTNRQERNHILDAALSSKNHYLQYQEQPEQLCDHKNPKLFHLAKNDSSSEEREKTETRHRPLQISGHPRQRRRHKILNDNSTLAHPHSNPSTSQSHMKTKPRDISDKTSQREHKNRDGTEVEILKKKHLLEIQHLREEMQQTDQENSVLRERMVALLEQESEWQETIAKLQRKEQDHLNAIESNAELNRRIAKLEVDTNQEVQLLCQKVKAIHHEKELTTTKLNSALQDIQSLQKKYEALQKENSSKISIETHVKSLDDNKKFVEDLKQKMQKEMDKLHKMYTAAEDEKNSNAIELLLQKDNEKRLQVEMVEMKTIREEILKEKNAINEDLQQAKQQNIKTSKLLTSVLQTAEEVTVQRNVLLTRLQLQDCHSEKMHSSVIEHTLNVGRLEECIMNLHKKMNEEVTKNALSTRDKELDYNNMKESYERQLEILRRHILQKNNLLEVLGGEKMKLESDLQNIWEASIASKKEEDIIQSLTSKYEKAMKLKE